MKLIEVNGTTNYYLELYQHNYMQDSLYGMVKERGVVVMTVQFKLKQYPLIVEICRGKDRKLLMGIYKNGTIKDLCKLRIRNKKPIKMVNYT